MQYILTQEERDNLVDKGDLILANCAIDTLRRMAVPEGKCVHDHKGPEYCDDCPLSDIGSNHVRRELSKAMCKLNRYYSK